DSILKFFKKWLPADILVAPHHGSDHGCVADVIKAIDPQYTVVSVGADNAYGHPDKAAMATYRRLTRKQVFTTKDDGSILFTLNDEGITHVVPDAGKDPEAVKEHAKQVAAALAGSGSVYIGPFG